VNAAMADALELARAVIAIVEESKPFEEALKEFEQELFSRGERFAQKTMKGLNHHFSEGGCEEMSNRLKAAYGKPAPK
jgi:2-polyprenyl-6-methoxyphenol hydroxylase-like FAD-dependent oxidoreductase